ncbi:TetR/AcrR family transcriptional regulator C-terminal domain-containing protein [Rhodococcus ruber]|uniref:TetR/AcrR family transcriptional regulator C-terminal domain-containing protein n=1 Tax=Rhodococcus ruber TaxID=1830 RepID=A0ABT4MES6_9NOCA|nr:TetR/AcrR family transcriptional regulator C-terminal domain-containing protein [Rhodococcus ruber]MCZ4519494.1 TetR/AcrR family transcriptional regulator C-terminal domain-containing protein [Rhodococcus ruber]
MKKKRHSRSDVVREALALLDEGGMEAVTLRGVAKRMGLHLNSVSFQVTSKAKLLELLAESILGELSLDNLPAAARERIAEVARRSRRAMLSHRDGARLVAMTETFDVNTLDYAEVVVSAFLELGVEEHTAARAMWGLHCLVLGLVEEEQAERMDSPRRDFDADTHPGLARVGSFFLDDSFAERAEFGIAALVSFAISTPARLSSD